MLNGLLMLKYLSYTAMSHLNLITSSISNSEYHFPFWAFPIKNPVSEINVLDFMIHTRTKILIQKKSGKILLVSLSFFEEKKENTFWYFCEK